MEQRYRLAENEFLNDGDSVIVYRRGSESPARLPLPVAQLLASCQTYATLAGHAASWCRANDLSALRQLGAAKSGSLFSRLAKKAHDYVERDIEDVNVDPKKLAAAQSQLEKFVAAGLLISESGFRNECKRHTSESPPEPIATVGMTSANRPIELERALRGYIENSRQYDRTCVFAVVDDSRDPLTEQTTRGLAAALSAEYDVEIRVSGQSEREDLVAALAATSGVDRETVRFAILGDERCPITTGSARNTLLLETVGSSYLLVDDDSVCRMARVPEPLPGLAFSSIRDPTEFWFFANRDQTLAQATFEEVDFLGIHEAMLGREVGALTETDPIDLDSAQPAFESRIRNHGGRIRASMAGILGDSGIGSSAYVTVNEQSRDRLTTSEAAYLAAVESRQVLRAVRRMTISEGAHCMAGNLGIDNRQLLPPFIPIQRNSDGKFAMLLRACFADAYAGHLPYAALHDPLGNRTHSVEQWLEDVQQVRFTDIVGFVLAMAPPPAPRLSPDECLQRLGKYFQDLASCPTAEFFEQLRLHFWKTRSQRPRPNDNGCPDFYTRRRQDFRETLAKAVVSPRYLVPRDLADAGDDEQVRELTRELITKTGHLIEVWPAIVSAATHPKAKAAAATTI